jgi:hypothetical protein
MSVLALGRQAVAATSNGPTADEAIVLVMLGLISFVVVSQAISLSKSLPGTRRIWARVAHNRHRTASPTPGRPMLAQANSRTLLPHLRPSDQAGGNGRLDRVARTAGWVALTLVIMVAAASGALLVAISAIRSLDTREWGLSNVFGLGMAALIGYGVATMSVGLIRSWFERRRRRLRRMLMRLLRYLLRGFERTTIITQPSSARFGLPGRALLVAAAAVTVIAAAVATPVSAENAAAASDGGPGTTMTSMVAATGGDDGTTAQVPTSGNRREVVDDVPRTHARPTTRVAGKETPGTVGTDPTRAAVASVATTTTPRDTATTTTTTSAATTTTTTRATTTTTASATTTTDTTTTTTSDTTGPVVSGIFHGPNPILTTGNTPDTTQITSTTRDKSGVASVTMYYRAGSGSFSVWATMKPGTTTTTLLGPFAKAGTFEYRIMATDTLGNTNCRTPSTCPGGTVTVLNP